MNDFFIILDRNFHLENVHSEKCSFGKCCTNPLDTSRHISKQHASLRPFACTECPKAYLHLKDLERHFTSTHEKEGQLNGRFECEECSKIFTHLYLLNCHKMCKHAEQKPFQCDQCTQSYKSIEGLKRHKLTVYEGVKLEKEKFLCSQCAASYTTKSSLEDHVNTVHENIRPYMCEHCSKGQAHDMFSQILPNVLFDLVFSNAQI